MAATPPQKLRRAASRLCRDLAGLEFRAPVTHVYNPLEYARRPYASYLERFAATRKRVVFLGMNPGPYGMVQTGVPFGEVGKVRNWLGIDARIDVPARVHPKRPVWGFACTRSEVSGERVWGAIERHFETPERFFAAHFIANYCPLVFMEASGRNRTPDKLPASERAPLFEACDRHLRTLVRVLDPEWLVGVGAFAEGRARAALGQSVRIGRVLHPSPASPLANRGWAAQAARELRKQGICPAPDSP